jgi:hypothetical protein
MSKSVLKNRQESRIQMLNPKEANELFDNTVQSYLGITADEFMEGYRKGEYKDACNNPRLLKVLMMIPKNR